MACDIAEEHCISSPIVVSETRPLPPVHLLHQVSTYQKACPIEPMRAVNTCGTPGKQQNNKTGIDSLTIMLLSNTFISTANKKSFLAILKLNYPL